MIQKSHIRQIYKNARKQLKAPLREILTNLVLNNIKSNINPRDFEGKNIAIYFPINNEVNILKLAEYLKNECKNIKFCFPVVLSRGQKLIFRECNPFKYWDYKRLISGNIYNKIPEPDIGCLEVVPDIIVAPLAAYDKKGNRLGMGGGYYDRTLDAISKKNNVRVLGLGYGWQCCNFLIPDEYDEPVEILK